MKVLLIIIAIIVVLGGGYFLVQKNKTTEVENRTNTPSATVTGDTYEWVFLEGETGSSGVPNTTVSLKVGRTTYPLGDYDGSCKEVKVNETGVLGEKADAGEISRAQCWFAGSGSEIGIFKVGPKIVIKIAELNEGENSGKPFRGNWKTLKEL